MYELRRTNPFVPAFLDSYRTLKAHAKLLDFTAYRTARLKSRQGSQEGYVVFVPGKGRVAASEGPAPTYPPLEPKLFEDFCLRKEQRRALDHSNLERSAIRNERMPVTDLLSQHASIIDGMSVTQHTKIILLYGWDNDLWCQRRIKALEQRAFSERVRLINMHFPERRLALMDIIAEYTLLRAAELQDPALQEMVLKELQNKLGLIKANKKMSELLGRILKQDPADLVAYLQYELGRIAQEIDAEGRDAI